MKTTPEQRAELRAVCELVTGGQMSKAPSRSSKILDLLDDLEAAEKEVTMWRNLYSPTPSSNSIRTGDD